MKHRFVRTGNFYDPNCWESGIVPNGGTIEILAECYVPSRPSENYSEYVPMKPYKVIDLKKLEQKYMKNNRRGR